MVGGRISISGLKQKKARRQPFADGGVRCISEGYFANSECFGIDLVVCV
jgi:hypothetical protein